MHTQLILNLIFGMAIANIAIPNFLIMKNLLLTIFAVLFITACSKDENINYYPMYQLTADISSSKQSYSLNNARSEGKLITFKFSDKHSGDNANIDLGCNPIIVLDSVITFYDSIVFDSLINDFDTLKIRKADYIYDTTFFEVTYMFKDNILYREKGYSTGYQKYKASYLIK